MSDNPDGYNVHRDMGMPDPYANRRLRNPQETPMKGVEPEYPPALPNQTPTWGTADAPAPDPSSDTVTMVTRLQVRDQVEVIGIGISLEDWEYDVADALTDLFTRFIEEAATAGIIPQTKWFVDIREDE